MMIVSKVMLVEPKLGLQWVNSIATRYIYRNKEINIEYKQTVKHMVYLDNNTYCDDIQGKVHVNLK